MGGSKTKNERRSGESARIREADLQRIESGLIYVQSDWCRLEAQLIGQRADCHTTRVIEVGLPPTPEVHSHFGFLGEEKVGRVNTTEEPLPDLAALESEMRRCNWPIPDVMRGLVRPVESASSSAHVRTPFNIEVPLVGFRSADEDPDAEYSSDEGHVEIQSFRHEER